jgi:hypothetical protein
VKAVAAVASLAVVAAGALVAGVALVGTGGGSTGSADDGAATSLAMVTRRSLFETTQFNGTLGHAGSYTVLGRAPGTVTWLPAIGQVIRQGTVLYRVNDAPVVLLYGTIPAYRNLAEAASPGVTTGRDVAQLNHDLVALGCVNAAEVRPEWDEFSWATKAGVERLQGRLGADATGELPLGSVVFLPTAARVESLGAQPGGPAAGPVLRATSTTPTVTVALDPDLRSQIKAGNRVAITLPDGRRSPGTVTSVGTVATAPASASGSPEAGPAVPVRIRPADRRAAGSLDQALVEVTITDRTVTGVLAVPVDALLARSGGGYSVEVVGTDSTHRLLRVRLGLFDDAAGLVQASGPGLRAGQRVVVPGDA